MSECIDVGVGTDAAGAGTRQISVTEPWERHSRGTSRHLRLLVTFCSKVRV